MNELKEFAESIKLQLNQTKKMISENEMDSDAKKYLNDQINSIEKSIASGDMNQILSTIEKLNDKNTKS